MHEFTAQITDLRNNLGFTVREVARSGKPVIVRRYDREEVIRRNETEFALTERKRRMANMKETARRLEHPQEVTNRDESAVRQQVTDLRDWAAKQEKVIGELEKTLATVVNEIAPTEKTAVHQRD